MHFLCLGYYDPEKWYAMDAADRNAIVSQCPPLDQKLKDTGKLVLHGSLHLPTATKSIRHRGGRAMVTDGPYAEAKEQVGGFFLIEANDIDDAVRIALNHPAANLGEAAGWGVEIRPIGFYEHL